MCTMHSYFVRNVQHVFLLGQLLAVVTTRTTNNVVILAVLPPHNPPWLPTYNMTESLITMQCNSSGWSSPERGAQFGIISYDWSNNKATWAASKPMNCEELLLEQAARTKQAGAKHVFVYRNIVKALPWFRTVREKMEDPAFDGFFLRFDDSTFSNRTEPYYHVPPCAAENASHCSPFYHDQEQTPQVPTPKNPHPDGSCVDYCDCGRRHPCGEYLFDHRNGTQLRDFLVHEVILGALATNSDGSLIVDGLFLDDFWCSDLICNETNNQTAGCPCHDPVQGPTEIDRYAVADMKLADADVRDITVEYNKTMTAIHRALLNHKAYTWSLIPDQENANAMPVLLTQPQCAHLLRENACTNEDGDGSKDTAPLWQRLPLLFGFTVGSVNGTAALTQLEVDLAFFLLARGPFAFAGWGVWGMTWPFYPEPAHGALPPQPDGVPLPSEYFIDYGQPLEVCRETSTGVFEESEILRCRLGPPAIKMICQRQGNYNK